MQKILRLLSYNIQSGLSTTKYSHYVTRSWKHLVPVPQRMVNLEGIAQVLTDYDIVGLQEVDTGSLRSGFVNQVKYLSERSGLGHLYDQSNRRIGLISQHSNAVLSRIPPAKIADHKLPGVPGRGVLHVTFGDGPEALHVFIIHMALSRRGRMRQIAFLGELMVDYQNVVVMGDLNCRSDSPEMALLLKTGGLCEPLPGLYTFPSWRPTRQLDHILVSPSIRIDHMAVLQHTYSDHLAIAMHIAIPRYSQIETAGE